MPEVASLSLVLGFPYADVPEMGSSVVVVTDNDHALAKQSADRRSVILVGVTVLTHLGLDDFRSLFSSGRGPADMVLALARTAQQAGLDGVVASARELPIIKQAMGAEFKVVTPGIRPAEAAADDQTRVATPSQAIEAGADYLVVGRPIIAAADPVAACERILADMG